MEHIHQCLFVYQEEIFTPSCPAMTQEVPGSWMAAERAGSCLYKHGLLQSACQSRGHTNDALGTWKRLLSPGVQPGRMGGHKGPEILCTAASSWMSFLHCRDLVLLLHLLLRLRLETRSLVTTWSCR